MLALGLPLLSGPLAPQGHLLASLARGDWALAGIDLFLLLTGLLCAFCARRLDVPSAVQVRPEQASREPAGEVR